MGRLIGLSGKAGSGKDTVAGFIPGNVVRMSFADPLKRFCQEVFDFSDDQVYGPSSERNKPDTRYVRPDGEYLTPRYALQTLGTEWGRGCFEDVWAALGVRKALAYLKEYPSDTVVFTDALFVNEARAIRNAGGEVWRIVRPGAALAGAAGAHPSEMEQESPEFQEHVSTVINNFASLPLLREMVRARFEGRESGADWDAILADFHG